MLAAGGKEQEGEESWERGHFAGGEAGRFARGLLLDGGGA
jgi:hypothetical protein